MPQQQCHYISFTAQVNDQTTRGLLNVCANLANQGVPEICLLLSSPGGSVMHGITIYNVLKGLPVKITTFNVGSVDSIGNVIFMAGERRLAAPHSTFLFHGVTFGPVPNIVFDEMLTKEKLGSIRADHARIASIISQDSNLSVEEIEQYFLESRTKTPDEALVDGLIHDVRDLQIPNGAPITQLTF